MIQRYQLGDQPKAGFEVIEVIRGGMGIVYVLQHETDRNFKIALKSCDSERMMTPEAGATVQQESLIWISLLPHPNIVRARSFEFDGGLPSLLLDYIAGGNLRTYLTNRKPTLDDILRIALEFCEGMIFLASNRIVHRDVKPENILLTTEGRVKITDFGLAKALHPLANQGLSTTGGSSELGDVGSFGGTIPYMAPEQFGSFNSADQRADVYSFGVVMYEMLAARLPFHEKSIKAMRKLHERAIPPALPDNVPLPMHNIVMKCLAKKPGDRYETFAALSDQITAFCRNNGFDASVPEHHSITLMEESLDSTDWNNRGYALTQLNDFLGALRCYHRAIEVAKSEDVSDNFAIVHGVDKRRPSSTASLATTYDNMGALLVRMGRREEGKNAFEQALNLVPDDGLAYLRLGQLELADGNVHAGLALIKKSVECEPGNNDLLLKYLRACYQFDIQEEFEPAFRRFLEAKKSDAPFLVVVGCHLDDVLGPDVALRCFDTVLRSDNDNVSAWYNKAITLHRTGKERAALRAYENVVRLQRDHPFARCYMAVILLKQKRRDEALWNLEQFLRHSGASPLHDLVMLAAQGASLGVPLDSLLAPLNSPLALKHIA